MFLSLASETPPHRAVQGSNRDSGELGRVVSGTLDGLIDGKDPATALADPGLDPVREQITSSSAIGWDP